ncbi:MAG: hypothetical protein IT373_12330 [Polyangiaceae bacterium]|nr:hypothetical protein [Polyangiaceae bacterium]
MALETFKKLPLGGVDRRALVRLLDEGGAAAAEGLFATQRPAIAPQGAELGRDAAVVVLGGSNGITRALAMQLVFGEHAAVYAVHYDSEKMQIGCFHAAAMARAATAEGRTVRFFNRDATKESTVEELVAALRQDGVRAVHLVNGIAAGAPKRYAEHGSYLVKDLDMAFDPLLQVPDFAHGPSFRKLGLVEVEVATPAEIERTNKFMGSSSLFWTEQLAQAGLVVAGESVVAFCDYDFPENDPVYGMGPLAGAKKLQRSSMQEIERRFGLRTVRLCYPAMATTALGAIPGGNLIYALTAEILLEQGRYQSMPDLARETMQMWREPLPRGELRLDTAYQACLPEYLRRLEALTPADVPRAFSRLLAS